MLRLPATATREEIIASLAIDRTPGPVLVLCSAAELEPGVRDYAGTVVAPAIAGAAARAGAVVVDAAADTGIWRLIGESCAQQSGGVPVLVGVAQAGEIAQGPDARTSGDGNGDRGGDAVPLVMAVAEALSAQGPVAVLVVGGANDAIAECAVAAHRRWPLLVFEGTGGFADRIASDVRLEGGPRDREVREIATGGDLTLVPQSGIDELTKRLTWELTPDPTLKEAWRQFAVYDFAAYRLRRSFERFQLAILLLGVVATLLALLHQALGTGVLRWSVIAAPIAVSALVGLAGRRAVGKRWIVLRAAAEATKSEIFRYRTRTGAYAERRRRGAAPRGQTLASRLARIETRVMHTEVSAGALPPYAGPLPPHMYGAAETDDGVSKLDAESYLRLRVGDQVTYYQGRVRQLDRRRSALQTLAILASAAGALVATAGAETWVALTAALGAAPLAYLAHLQIDPTVVSYNQSAAKLTNLARSWHSRTNHTGKAYDELVSDVEFVLMSERGGWMHHMDESLHDLQTHSHRETN